MKKIIKKWLGITVLEDEMVNSNIAFTRIQTMFDITLDKIGYKVVIKDSDLFDGPKDSAYVCSTQQGDDFFDVYVVKKQIKTVTKKATKKTVSKKK